MNRIYLFIAFVILLILVFAPIWNRTVEGHDFNGQVTFMSTERVSISRLIGQYYGL